MRLKIERSKEERGMPTKAVVRYALLAGIVIGILYNIKDIARYVHISRM